MPPYLRPNIIITKGGYGFLDARLKEVKETSDVDILFLGSSHSYRGFDNRIFKAHGYNTFNLGSSAQTPIQTEVLLDRYLDKLNPDLVIFEVYPGIFCSDGVESSLDLISNDRNDIYSIEMMLRIQNVKTFNSLLFTFMNDFFFEESISGSEKNAEDVYVSGGYVERKFESYSPITFSNVDWNYNNSQFSAFDRILQKLIDRQIQTVLVFAPVTSTYYNGFKGMNEFDRKMQSYQKQYYNFNNGLVELNDSIHFYDKDHLNQSGVEIFNLKLIDILKN